LGVKTGRGKFSGKKRGGEGRQKIGLGLALLGLG